jgi:hypothetical protein
LRYELPLPLPLVAVVDAFHSILHPQYHTIGIVCHPLLKWFVSFEVVVVVVAVVAVVVVFGI